MMDQKIGAFQFVRITQKMFKKEIFKIPSIGINFEKLANRKNFKSQIHQELGIDTNDFVLIYIAELISNKNQGKLIDTVKLFNAKRSI